MPYPLPSTQSSSTWRTRTACPPKNSPQNTIESVGIIYSIRQNVPLSVSHWQIKLSRDEDNDASLVLINSGISALSNAEHTRFCPSHQGCLHSREKTGSYSLPPLNFWFELLTIRVFKAVCAVYKAFLIISFLPPPMWTWFIQLSISRFLTIGGGNQSAASLSSPFRSPLSPSVPGEDFVAV